MANEFNRGTVIQGRTQADRTAMMRACASYMLRVYNYMGERPGH